jgi:hypothetical protein
LQTLPQAYIDRWEIECNHRDEKSLIGAAQGQVWNPLAVTRLPQFQVAIYSLLLLASILAYGFQRTAAYLPLPLMEKKIHSPFGLGSPEPTPRPNLCSWHAGSSPRRILMTSRFLLPADANASKPRPASVHALKWPISRAAFQAARAG